MRKKRLFHQCFKHLISLFALIKLHYFFWCPHVSKIKPSSSSQSHSSSSLKGLSSLGGSWNLMFASMSLITTMRRLTSWFSSRPAWATSPSSSLGSSFTTEQEAADECVLHLSISASSNRNPTRTTLSNSDSLFYILCLFTLSVKAWF